MPFQTELNKKKISEVCSVTTVVWWVIWECWEECTSYPQLEEVQQPEITRDSAALAGMCIMPMIKEVLLCHWENLSNEEELRMCHALDLYGNSGADDTWAIW